MNIRRSGARFVVAVLVLAACGGCSSGSGSNRTASPADSGGATTVAAAGDGGTTAALAAGDCVVGVAWNNFVGERWAKWDEPAMRAAVEAGGGTYVSNKVTSSPETQARNVENLISEGAKVLIVLAEDASAVKAAVATAISHGVPVIAYERLIEDPGALYITFDNVDVGRMQAREVFKVVPKGKYIVIKGDKSDPNSDFLRHGYDEVIGDAVKVGDIQIVGDTYTEYWDPATAEIETRQLLTAANNDVQAVLSENDGMAGGVVAALAERGLAGKVPVSGQDGDQAALNRVALGKQTVSVWKDARELGRTAGEAAVALCKDADVTKVVGTTPFTTPGGVEITSIVLKPIPITKDNLNVVLDAGWIDKAALCQGVTASSVTACG